jgi:hypothetical protein
MPTADAPQGNTMHCHDLILIWNLVDASFPCAKNPPSQLGRSQIQERWSPYRNFCGYRQAFHQQPLEDPVISGRSMQDEGGRIPTDRSEQEPYVTPPCHPADRSDSPPPLF